VWAGCGRLAAGAALADGRGLALAAVARLTLAGAPPDGAADAHPATARASAAPTAAEVLIRLVWVMLGGAQDRPATRPVSGMIGRRRP